MAGIPKDRVRAHICWGNNDTRTSRYCLVPILPRPCRADVGAGDRIRHPNAGNPRGILVSGTVMGANARPVPLNAADELGTARCAGNGREFGEWAIGLRSQSEEFLSSVHDRCI